MRKTTIWTPITLAAVGASALALQGCPNPNTYGTPRTTPTGKISHTVAAEGFGYKVTVKCPTGVPPGSCTDTTESASFPTLPTYQLRVGLADRLDLGARVANMTALGTDLKWNFVKSDIFDAAIDPGMQFFQLSASSFDSNGNSIDSKTNVFYFHGPILLGLNAGKAFSVVLSPGVTYGIVSSSLSTTDAGDVAQTASGFMGRLGLGLDFRIFDNFAIHPEITFLKTFDEPSRLLYIYGLGFNFGHLPDFSGTEEGAPPPPQQLPPQ